MTVPTLDTGRSPIPIPVALVLVYVTAMPLLAGLPRGTIVALLRPSEGLQLAVTGVAVAVAGLRIGAGRRWCLRLQPVDWWVVAVAGAASLLPVLWLTARGLPVGQDELLAAFPLVKYALLYFLVRACISSADQLEILSKAVVAVGLLLSAIAVAQVANVGPVIDVLGRFYVSGVEDVVDQGRGTTTLGSSIATGALLALACGLALSWGFTTGRRGWGAAAGGLAVGALASGQAGSVIALAVVVLAVAHLHDRLGQLVRWGIPAGGLAVVGLWPVVAARLADLDANTGLPSSWLIRWNNVSELYLPSLADGGWLLGVSPDAILAPPDVWREFIYLESGYLWLLWVGGVPLLVAALGLWVSAWRALDPQGWTDRGATDAPVVAGTAVTVAARAAVAMLVVLSLLDPHLSLRGGADLFFLLVALGLSRRPVTVEVPAASMVVRRLTAAHQTAGPNAGAIRVVISELATDTGSDAGRGAGADDRSGLTLTTKVDGRNSGSLDLVLDRTTGQLRGTIIDRSTGADPGGPTGPDAVLWRNLFLVARSLRVRTLRFDSDETALIRSDLRAAARLAQRLELARTASQHRVTRAHSTDSPNQSPDTPTQSPDTPTQSPDTPNEVLGVRLDPGHRVPGWKRAVDLTVGATALIGTMPLWLVVAVAVRRSSPGPVLYRQIRVGTGGYPFHILKFRTMFVDNDDSAHREQNRREILENGEASKDDADPRITPVGRFLRRTSLDELPQLINVLRADMSLVGPRPSLLWETELFRPETRRRLRSRPGITGLWQVNGRADLSMSEMLVLDLEYVDRVSPRLDLTCLVKTATSVAAGEGAR